MDIGELHSQRDDSADKVEELMKEKGQIVAHLETLMEGMQGIGLEKKAELAIMATFDGIPEKFKKQTDVLANGLKSLRSQEQSYTDKIKEIETHFANLHENMKQVTEEHARLALELERTRQLCEQREQSNGEMKKELELHSLDADQYLADRVNLDMQLKALQTDYKIEQERLVTRTTEKDKLMKKVKATEGVLKQLQDTIPSIANVKSSAANQLAQVENERRKVHATVVEIKRDMDGRMRVYGELESHGKEIVAILREGHKKAAELELEVIQCIGYDYSRQVKAGELASMRENICRVLSSKMHQLKEAKERIRVADITIGFLEKKAADLADAYSKFSVICDVLRSQRNKSVKLLQLSKLSINELKDKMSMLDIEVNMLQNEVLYKDKVLTKMRKEFAIVVQHRFVLRSELIGCHIKLQKLQELADEHLIEIKRLNSLLKSAEREMHSFRAHYEQAVSTRNHTGISLIDRNDELCILYEKSHAQEELLKHSEIELLKRENEISLLKPELVNLERYILLCYRTLPNAIEIRKTIKDLKSQLRLTMQESERLSKLVENPENKSHWRVLEGNDPNETELMAKLTALEFFLNRKADQSLEKNLLLEEVTALAEDLKKQAADGYYDSMETLSQLSRYQRQIRHLTQQMMAAVSELSLSQAMAMSLKQEKESLQVILQEATTRFENGEAPTPDCEREWHHLRRLSVSANGTRDPLDHGARRATAEPRPNAYIPADNYGLPKPFGGAHPPFRPSEQGPWIRHIRKPDQAYYES